jgi:SSS family solute:Na+ symporter/sodium/pantothenate symporter
VIAIATNVYPVEYLQAIIVFCGAGQAAAFAVPGLMTAYWRRATATGTIAAMLAGAGTVVGLYAIGWLPDEVLPAPLVNEEVLFTGNTFRPFYLLGIDPIVWGLSMSTLAGVAVSLVTKPPAPEVISKLFDAEPQTA